MNATLEYPRARLAPDTSFGSLAKICKEVTYAGGIEGNFLDQLPKATRVNSPPRLVPYSRKTQPHLEED